MNFLDLLDERECAATLAAALAFLGNCDDGAEVASSSEQAGSSVRMKYCCSFAINRQRCRCTLRACENLVPHVER